MPLFGAPVAAYQQISRATSTPFPLPTAGIEETILDVDLTRKGHLIRNTGTTEVSILYGLKTDENIELYRIVLAPKESYLYDLAEIIPYSAISKTEDGEIQVMELF